MVFGPPAELFGQRDDRGIDQRVPNSAEQLLTMSVSEIRDALAS